MPSIESDRYVCPEDSGIPERYSQLTFDDFGPTVSPAAAAGLAAARRMVLIPTTTIGSARSS